MIKLGLRSLGVVKGCLVSPRLSPIADLGSCSGWMHDGGPLPGSLAQIPIGLHKPPRGGAKGIDRAPQAGAAPYDLGRVGTEAVISQV